MVRKVFLVIFISILVVGCDNHFLDPHSDNTNTEYYLMLQSDLHMDGNGYYHIEFLEGYSQTFATLDANTGSDKVYQKVHWGSDSGINENFTGDFVSCVNPASYTDEFGVAHTVFSAWEQMVFDTIRVYAWYTDDKNNNYFDEMEIIVDNEI